MSLLGRIWRIFRAQINSIVDGAEDPEKILEQAILDMEQDLIGLRQGVAGAIASLKRTERQLKENKAAADQWYGRAQLALRKQDDRLAREALIRRQPYLTTAETLQTEIDKQTEIVNKLRRDMGVLESKISQTKMKKNLYIARARSAVAKEKMQQVAGNLNTGISVNAFQQMEDQVIELEARAALVAELETDSLESKLAALEGGEEKGQRR